MKWLKLFYRRLCQSLRLMVGVPDYEAFVQHWKTHHQGNQSDDACPTYEAFFRERQAKRYSSATGKCC